MPKNKKGNGAYPKIASNPPPKEIRTKYNPDSSATDHQTIAWQFHRCDEDDPRWGWGKLQPSERLKVLKQLSSFETIKWQDLKSQSGGKAAGNGTNHHSLMLENFSKPTRERLKELKLDDNDSIFSLRIANKVRLYGIRDGRVLRFIWHDPHHGDKDGAYPTKK